MNIVINEKDLCSWDKNKERTQQRTVVYTSFLAKSKPDKSSLGSGSVYPNSFALNTTEENDVSEDFPHSLNIKESVPENIPSNLWT